MRSNDFPHIQCWESQIEHGIRFDIWFSWFTGRVGGLDGVADVSGFVTCYFVQCVAGGGMQSYEIQAALGKMYMEGGENLAADYAISSECYNEAAESATEAMKGKLAQKYYEQAAIAESM